MAIDDYVPDANYVNAHALEIAAGAAAVWDAIPQALSATRPVAFLLGASAVVRGEGFRRPPRGTLVLREGEELAGNGLMMVDRVEKGREVVLRGRHRYATYATNVFLERSSNGTRAINVTRARFRTDAAGRAYLAGVRLFHDRLIEGVLRRLAEHARSDRGSAGGRR